MINKPNVDIVIVTFNRLTKLKRALECYDKQTEPFRTMIVVDNNSTDGTQDYLKQWESEPSAYTKHVIYLEKNVGGSGGFYAGEKYALTLNPDWVYVADDDAYPDADMMSLFYAFEKQHREEKISVISTTVTFIDRNIIHGCRKHTRIEDNRLIMDYATADEYTKPYFECNSVSYVGAFISAKALQEEGVVNGDLFIYQDDTEHSVRLAKYGKMYCVPKMVVVHDSVPDTNLSKVDALKILWKEYYSYRNRMYLLLKHYPKIGRAEMIGELSQVVSHKSATMSPLDKMKLEGYYDAWRGRLGLHKVYKPGLVLSNEINKSLPYPKALWEVIYWTLRIRNLFKKE